MKKVVLIIGFIFLTALLFCGHEGCFLKGGINLTTATGDYSEVSGIVSGKPTGSHLNYQVAGYSQIPLKKDDLYCGIGLRFNTKSLNYSKRAYNYEGEIEKHTVNLESYALEVPLDLIWYLHHNYGISFGLSYSFPLEIGIEAGDSWDDKYNSSLNVEIGTKYHYKRSIVEIRYLHELLNHYTKNYKAELFRRQVMLNIGFKLF